MFRNWASVYRHARLRLLSIQLYLNFRSGHFYFPGIKQIYEFGRVTLYHFATPRLRDLFFILLLSEHVVLVSIGNEVETSKAKIRKAEVAVASAMRIKIMLRYFFLCVTFQSSAMCGTQTFLRAIFSLLRR